MIGINEIKDHLTDIDKYLFVMFRNKEITFDQLKCRLAEKNQGIKYQCLDDLRGTLGPEIEKGMNDELFFKLYKSEVKNGMRVVPVSEFHQPM